MCVASDHHSELVVNPFHVVVLLTMEHLQNPQRQETALMHVAGHGLLGDAEALVERGAELDAQDAVRLDG